MSIRLMDTTTLQMRVFVGESIPKYAILSHTWVEDEEVNFQEMTAIACDRRRPATLKSGYRKILSTCEKARRHNINYVWVDTCCIDKSSSAELSEAINSMFKWYRNAEVCYVFLSDLEPESYVELAMKSCRWFKRGWTLQELIAPEYLRFYNRNWEFVGTKSELSSTVCAITGVDQVVLTDCTFLPGIPVARRMFWASQRTTTRTEDLTYCLLGIFDVNMPLLYGEGDKAFIRLQEEIIKRSNDLSIFWSFPSTSAADLHERKYLRDYLCRDLFATAPRDFSKSGDIFPDYLHSGHIRDFALTNNGIRFVNAEFKIVQKLGDYPSCYYAMDLQHFDPGWSFCQMVLQKIGPSLFVRCALSLEECRALYRDSVARSVCCAAEDAYIVSKNSAFIEHRRDTSRHYAISFQIDSCIERQKEYFYPVIEAPTPCENWNAAHQEFITMGKPFQGYVSLLLRDKYSSSSGTYCYLAFSLILSDSHTLDPKYCLRLLEPNDLEKHQARSTRGLGLTTLLIKHPGQRQKTEDQLVLDGVAFAARFEVADDRDYPSYRITIRFEHHPNSAI
ncbi:hypothetical protein PV04_02567 [Phialophora macrospora]|uniref:Heterokaryon incompatibility domain-containing protein n=1 Tax=Phialophora macrospora TaxID=1851006 RepID=A0A0D2E7I0_9EURO|nr:hypothetical protein PV04_02567 [Phialophora macrospora]